MRSGRCRYLSLLGLSFVVAGLVSGCSRAPIQPTRPNVVLIVVDTLRADRLPMYGAPRNTAPFLSEFCERCRVFENAWSASSWTLPATVSLLTSKHPYQHGVVSLKGLEPEPGDEPLPVNCIPEEIETLPEILKTNGYRTFGIASNILVGEEVGFGRGFDRFVKLDDQPADRVNAQVAMWRDEILGGEPFFMYLHYFDPHDTFHAREPWFTPYLEPTDSGWPKAVVGRSENDHEQIDWIRTRLSRGPGDLDSVASSELSLKVLDRLFAWIKAAYDSEIGFFDESFREI